MDLKVNMSRNNLDQAEFQLVSHKKKPSKSVNLMNVPLLNEPIKPNFINLESTLKRIQAAKEDLLTSDVYSSILASLREGSNILHSPEIKEIVCFGLGKIGECTIARYQLALLLCLRDLYQVEVIVNDPVFSDDDHKILDSVNFKVLPDNIEGKYCICKYSTLFYLPHCPKQLMNNLLWVNWGVELSNCIIIGNSFTTLINSNSNRHLLENARYMLNIFPYTTELAIINSFKYLDIFNDTAIHIFPLQNICLISHDFWDYRKEPNYCDREVEFIANKLQAKVEIGL